MSAAHRAALAFILGALFFGYAFALRVSPSIMVGDLMRAFAVGGAVLGNLSAFYFYAYSGLQIPVGMLLDRFGTRRPMTVAAAVVAGGTLTFALSETIESAYLGRLLIGAGCAFSWVGALAIANQWFPARFALLAGVSQMIAMGGAMLGQAPLAVVVTRFGWRDAMIGLAMVGTALAALIFLVARDRPPSHDPDRSRVAGERDVIRNPQTWLAAGFGLTMVGPMLAFGALWGVPYLEVTQGLERTAAAGVASLVFLGNGVGGVLLGWWSDRIRRRKGPMLAGSILCVLSQFAFLWLPGLPFAAMCILIFLTGVGGASMILAFAVGREHNTLANAGLTIGIINTAVTGNGALLQPLIGWLLDLGWDGTLVDGARVYGASSFRQAMTVVPVISGLGLGLLFAIKEPGGARQ